MRHQGIDATANPSPSELSLSLDRPPMGGVPEGGSTPSILGRADHVLTEDLRVSHADPIGFRS